MPLRMIVHEVLRYCTCDNVSNILHCSRWLKYALLDGATLCARQAVNKSWRALQARATAQ